MDADAVRREWTNRSGEYSPGYYAYYGPNETSEAIRGLLDAVLDRDAAVLELGCSSGRHLHHLHEHGYRNLSGVEINDDALDVMRDTYPDLAAAGTFYFDAIEDVVAGFDDGQFDAVYSVEALQHVHRDSEWVFEEVARVTDDVLVTAEIEPDDERQQSATVKYIDDEFPLYFRDWEEAFAGFGLVQVDSRAVGRDTLRLFRHGGR